MSGKNFASVFSIQVCNAADKDGETSVGAHLCHCVMSISSAIAIQTPEVASDYLLILVVEPPSSTDPHFWLSVNVNGERCRHLIMRRRSVLCCRLRWELLQRERQLHISFNTSCLTGHPYVGGSSGPLSISEISLIKFASPSVITKASMVEVKENSVSLGAPISEMDMLSRFISLGDNCEFGLYQRRCGVDSVGLFRLAGVPLNGLILALTEEFKGFYDPEELYFEIVPYANGREYILFHQRYEMVWHTLVDEPQIKPSKMIEREYNKLSMLVRMLLEVLAEGNKILVYKCNVGIDELHSIRLWHSLRSYGRNALLIVAPAQRQEDIGKVVMSDHGFMTGYMDSLLSYHAADLPASDTWMTICRNAEMCWRKHDFANFASLSQS